jgi:hypothetical protein
MILNPASRKKRIFAAPVDIVIVVVVYFFVVVMFGNKPEDASGHAKICIIGSACIFPFSLHLGLFYNT